MAAAPPTTKSATERSAFDRELTERLVRYARIDTQSDERSTTSPSTHKQYDLLRLLVDELSTLGAEDVRLTDYGVVLIRKLVVLLPVFALAALNRWWFTARAAAPRSARAMARTVAVETLLIFAVLGIVASWRFTPPPRALTLANSTAIAHIHTDKAMAEVTIRPDAAGPVSISILIMTGDFAPLEPKEVALSLALPDGDCHHPQSQ